jgi:hypothetical protein
MQALQIPEHPEAVLILPDRTGLQRQPIIIQEAILHLQPVRRAAQLIHLQDRTNLHQAAPTAPVLNREAAILHQAQALRAAILLVLHRQALPGPLPHRTVHPGVDDKGK